MSEAQVVEATNKIDDIATGLASRETVPEVFVRADDEGVRIVTTVQWTRTNELVTARA